MLEKRLLTISSGINDAEGAPPIDAFAFTLFEPPEYTNVMSLGRVTINTPSLN
jgi:hypothetical protein